MLMTSFFACSCRKLLHWCTMHLMKVTSLDQAKGKPQWIQWARGSQNLVIWLPQNHSPPPHPPKNNSFNTFNTFFVFRSKDHENIKVKNSIAEEILMAKENVYSKTLVNSKLCPLYKNCTDKGMHHRSYSTLFWIKTQGVERKCSFWSG